MPSDAPSRLATALERVPETVRRRHVASAAFVRLPAPVPPWTATPIGLARGEAFSWFAEGRVVLSEAAGLWNGPAFHLWGRVAGAEWGRVAGAEWGRVAGAGPLLKGTRDTASFVAPATGALELCICSGEWGTRDGALATPVAGYALLSGGLDVLVVRWRGDARAGVEALAEALPDEPAFAAERARLRAPTPVPPGWHYLWFLGPADIYRPARVDGAASIRVETRDDVGILQRPLDLPLAPDARLSWRWRVDELPSLTAEDALPRHDYLSIAVEFENGQDLTWYWSAALPPEHHYRCPLPGWDRRETHLVVRSGTDGLGAWQREERRVHADYARAVGEPPGRIVAVWLIAVSLFQKRRGAAEFRDVWLESGGRRVQVL